MSVLLEVRNLSKYFRVASGALHAVDNVSFTIDAGKTLGIVGESGCGKSTLGRAILRLQEPTAGRVFFDGMDITSFSKEEMRQIRQHMQIIFQDPYASLNPRLTIAQSIEEPLKVFQPKLTEAERRNRIEELMELVGLSRRNFNAYPHEFDGGRRQRVVIARTLAAEPRFVVCDEPVSALDVSVQAQILNLMMDLQKQLELTFVFISHDLSVVRHISDAVGVMYLGQIVEYADKDTLFQNPGHPYTRALLSAIPSVDLDERRERIILKGEITSPINPKPGCRFAPRCEYATPQCTAADVELEDAGGGHMIACVRRRELFT
ncbi:dipeptide ABC transporter ATP-binding protein [Ruminococcaceae bacterium OttesenSCG-928-D13]|nr:dipeptide ABC transporter ATP-binding protein [Ruminococcaceae bacterium OttesenSCG-928-D13]